MCGIAGILGLEGSDARGPLAAMNSALEHRGPDDSGVFLHGAAGIAMRRLAIVDLDGGQQPILNEDQQLAIVGNGEIYNAPELRPELEKRGHRFRSGSDIETVLHLFEELGPEGLHYLNGMFAVAILDRHHQRIFVARDRLGIKPLFYSETDRGTLFASELPALRAGVEQLNRGALTIDRESLTSFLQFGYVPNSNTMHRELRKLPAGHYAWISPHGVTEHEWWRFPLPSEAAEPSRSLDEWSDELEALLRDSVRLRTMGDVRAGAFLSGGLDSGTILSLLSQHAPAPVPAFTIGFGDPRLDEIEDAKLSARHSGADHHVELVADVDLAELEQLFGAFGEPFADVSLLPTHRVARLAARHVKFVLSGDGGDELFAGYAWLQREVRYRRLPSPLLATARLLRPVLAHGQRSTRANWWGKVLRVAGDLSASPAQSFLRRRSLCPAALLPRLIHSRWNDVAHNEDPLARYAGNWQGDPLALLVDLDRRFYLGGDILEKVDRATMMHSLEARVPFLDHRIVELAARIPMATHLGPSGSGKTVLRHCMLRNRNQPWVPTALLGRPKRGFGIPVDRWFQGQLLEQVEERLRERHFRELELLEPTTVANVIDEHRTGKARHGHLIWGLLSLATWANPARATAPLGSEVTALA